MGTMIGFDGGAARNAEGCAVVSMARSCNLAAILFWVFSAISLWRGELKSLLRLFIRNGGSYLVVALVAT